MQHSDAPLHHAELNTTAISPLTVSKETRTGLSVNENRRQENYLHGGRVRTLSSITCNCLQSLLSRLERVDRSQQLVASDEVYGESENLHRYKVTVYLPHTQQGHVWVHGSGLGHRKLQLMGPVAWERGVLDRWYNTRF